ncbi:MAG TPA: aspartate/glutamate racemase family protein [Candidatus Dormibacteraeota bacterium]
MNLLYILVDDLHPSPEEVQRLTSGGLAAVGPDSTFTVQPIDFGPLHYYESAVGLAMAVPGVLHKILTEQHRFDAALLGCFGDPGLRAARTVATIPVIGAAEAATALAQLVAQRYGVVTIVDSQVPELEAYLSSLEVRHRCVGINAIGLQYYELVADPEVTLNLLATAASKLLEKGAEAILLGCMSFGFHPFASRLQELIGVPVIDPLRAGVAAARAMLTMGVLPSPRNLPPIDDSSHLMRYLASVAGSASPSLEKVAGRTTA